MSLRCFISGAEYTMVNKYSITEQTGQATSASIYVLLEDNDIPISQGLVEIKESDLTPIYTGIIQIVESPKWSSTYETEIYTLTVKSMEVIFGQRIVVESITNSYTHEIVDYLFDEYLAEEGLTKGTITTFDQYYENYVSNGLTLLQVLNELTSAVDAVARISPSKVFSFTSADDYVSVTPPTHIKLMRQKESGQDLITVQRLTGSSEETSLLSKSEFWVDGQDSLLLGYQVSSISGITINSVPVGVGILGVDEGDETVTFLYKYGSNIITLNGSATTLPTTDDLIGVVYYGYYDIDITVENESLKAEIAALNGTSGKIESLVTDTSITNTTDGESEASALLNASSEREQTLSIEYNSDDLSISELLNSWNMAYTELGISGAYVITSRTITDFGDEYALSLKLKNRNFMTTNGSVFDKNDTTLKNLTVRTDVVVAKTSTIMEALETVEEYQLNTAGTFFFPVAATGGELYSPEGLDGFYPI